MTFDNYQKAALTTALSTHDNVKDLAHWVLGIVGESGEVAEKVKKIIRDNNAEFTDEAKQELAKELGDILWYLAVFADYLGVSFEAVASANVEKLRSRQLRGALRGSGDNR